MPIRFPLALLAASLLSACISPGKGIKTPASVAPIGSAEFRQVMGHVVGPPFSGGNRITTLENGSGILPDVLRTIRSSRRTITLETFVWEKSEVGRDFAEALAERARAGVKVHLIVDAFGGRGFRAYRGMLRDAGAQIVTYHPILLGLRNRNHRTHRKLLVVDGRIGYTGGLGIADEWAGQAEAPEHWHDTHYRVEGPIVAALQAIFMENWMENTGELLHGSDYFPPLAPAGSLQASAFASSPEQGSRRVEWMDRIVIASAQRTLLIETPYFLPDNGTLEALIAAARRGVQIQLLMPGEHIDQKAVRRGSRRRWPRLLEAGVEIYEYAPTMTHTKLMIADDLFVSIGSANWDSRSLRINDEANMNVLDRGFAAEQSRIFRHDIGSSRQITLDELRHRKPVDAPAQAVQAPVEGQL